MLGVEWFSRSNAHTAKLRKPTVLPEHDLSGIRRRSKSSSDEREMQALPSGVAVCDSGSRTSYAVSRTLAEPVSPSLARKLMVLRKLGLLLR